MDDKDLVNKITAEVMKRLNQRGAKEAAPSEPPSDGGSLATVDVPILPSDAAKFIDHTLLKPEASAEEIDTLCDEAVANGFYSVCVNSSWVTRCTKRLSGSNVKVCAVVGFPLGAMSPRAKSFETRHAVQHGAREIDMVANVGALKSRDVKIVREDILAVRRACPRNVVLKVIIETALLTDEEKVIACQIAKDAEADFVKTSTGFSHHGATVADVRLMRRTVGPKLGVKAAGGVRSFADLVDMVNAGATRIGTSSGVKIVSGQQADSAY